MEKGFMSYVKKVEAKEMTVSEACAELGISRQTWYNRLKTGGVPGKPGRPRKKPVEEAPKMDFEAFKEAQRQAEAKWLPNLDKARWAMMEWLDKTFPRAWWNLQFEHVDAVGFWFTFGLTVCDKRQTWCIPHKEVAA